ncbi:SRPBCC family protein [Nodosilinea sp. LEGE 07088]|nr:SRPBCC family protein [Nodosilinea sp. LEGE 07088]
MNLLKKFVGFLVVLIALVVAGGYLLPSTVHVERDILVDAPPEQVYALISDFHAWDDWSPWAKLDPNAEMTISGSGVDQTMTWASENPQVGKGTQTIVTMDAPKSLQTHLELGDMGKADAHFTLQPEADQTRVVWSLDTDMREGVPTLKQPINTYFGFLMDSMLGSDYETGLQNLKDLAEG